MINKNAFEIEFHFAKDSRNMLKPVTITNKKWYKVLKD